MSTHPDEFSIPINSPNEIDDIKSSSASHRLKNKTQAEGMAETPSQNQTLGAPYQAYVEVDLGAIGANYRLINELAPQADIAPVVKCDGYGLGASAIARTLIENEGCRSFFVAHPLEGVRLRENLGGISSNSDVNIIIFNGPDSNSLAWFRDHNLTPVLNTVTQAKLWASAFPGVEAFVHVDTGMNRLGIDPNKINYLDQIDGLNITTVMSHLAIASDPSNSMNARQRKNFLAAAMHFPGARLSLSASGGAFMPAGYHYSQIRLGISLYGSSVTEERDTRLKRVARLFAPIMQLRDIPKGASVGYDMTWTAERASRIATIGIGYGDGYPRLVSNKGAVVIDGIRCPLVGRVSMDLITVDVSEVGQGIGIGDRAEIFGHSLHLEELAQMADTIPYEILTQIGPRIERIYTS